MCISLRLRQIVFIAAAVVALGFAAPASALVVKEMSGPTPSALAGKGSGVWKKAGSRLRQLYGQFLQQGRPPLFTSDIPRVQLENGKILIDATAVSDGAQLFADLKRLGLSGGAHSGAVVSGWIPLGKLEQAVALGSLRSVSASLRPITNAGAVTSQGVQAMNATSLGFDGTGVTVGVLSDSYNLNHSAATTASDDIASGDLPAGVNVLEEEPSTICPYGSCTDEGRAMMQIVHDVAPGASLAFHTAFNGDADFAQGILDLASAGAKVIVDDVAYFNEPMFQDGIIAQAVDTVKSQGVAYFSAAGNSARRSYESPFVDSGEPLTVLECDPSGLFCVPMNVGDLHNFAPSGAQVDYYQSITIPDGASLTIVLNWDQPSASVSPGNGSQSDMDIWLMNSAGVIVASSKDDNIQTGNPLEILQYAPPSGSGGTYRLMISHFSGPAPGLMKYINLSGYNVTVTNYTTNSSANFGHSNAAGAEAVGAADYMYTPYWTCPGVSCLSAAELSYFSSAGGTPILFDTSGNRLSSPVYRNKPGIVAPDGGNTTFFYPGSDYDGDGWPNFFGTSAAAPHAAGVAAVLKSANSALSPAQIYSTLQTTAAPMTQRCVIGTPGTSTVSCPSTTDITATEGYNYDAGFGFIQADQAIAAVTGGSGGGTPAPTCSLTADPPSITNGGSSTLTWTTTNATSLSIDQGIGSVALSGSKQVNPTVTTTYTGTVTGDGGTNTCSATLTVTQPPPPAALSLSLNPSSMSLSRKGQNSKTTVVTVNGPDSDTVTLSVSGLPNNVTPVWTGNPVTISSGSGTAQLQLVAGSRGPKGTFTVTVTGTDPSSNQANATLLLTVTR
jgi:hypothetical protein